MPPLLRSDRLATIQALFDDYMAQYATRDDRLTTRFSANFSGYSGGGDVLVKDRAEWVKITRQDFAQVPQPLRIEMLDLSLQDLCQEVVVVTAFFHIHLPGAEQVLSRETARLVLIFRLESDDWKIVHSGISIPYHLVQAGEVYPLKGLQDRNTALESLVAQRTKELRESEALYRLLTEETLDVVWKTDRDLRITYISPADERLRGFKAEEVLGQHVFELFTEEGVATVQNILNNQPQAGEGKQSPEGFWTFSAQHRAKNGRTLWGEVLAKPEYDAQGNIIGYHGSTRECTDRVRLENEVRHLAFFDPLTSLPNRRLLDDRLGQSLVVSKRSGNYGAVMVLDLDNFKTLNDLHGHHVGDLLLLEVGRRLVDCVRQKDTVARFGGDEFVVIVGELSADQQRSIQQAMEVAEKIRASLVAPYVLTVSQSGQADATVQHHCSASIGLTLFLGQESNQNDLLKWADAAMYQAKAAGRNAIRLSYG
jgi:diguanylate cyclase (GGDEF)-like protein/PAS domain S-box-containing protein